MPAENRAGLGRRFPALWYAVVASVVVLVAAALRFGGLGESSLSMDEATAALFAQGSFTELVEKTENNTSPFLYPFALWLIQKVEVSTFSVRLLPAAASVLTVAVLLFLLPRAGVPRRAALLAGVLAAVCVPAIVEAHGSRVYSVDALLAALLLVGLLRIVRDRRKWFLLGGCLFLAPLVQYGLVLFGAAVLVTAFVRCGPRGVPTHRGLRAQLGARVGLLPPAALFGLGCAFIYFTLFRRQTGDFNSVRGFVLDHLRDGYYLGDPADLASLTAFVTDRVRILLQDQLAAPLVAAVLFGAGLLLAIRGARAVLRPRGFREEAPETASPLKTVLLLSAVALAVAVIAAAAGIYPLGTGRHDTYLGPVIFSAAGFLLAAATTAPAAALRRWPATALFVVTLSGIAWAGAADLARRTSFSGAGTGEEVAAALAAEAEPDDLIFVLAGAQAIVDFYLPARLREQVVRGHGTCFRNLSCTDQIARVVRDRPEAAGRLWVVTGPLDGPWLREGLRAWSADRRLHTVVRADGISWEQWGSDLRLYRIDGLAAAVSDRFPPAASGERWGVRWGEVEWDEPTIRSYFDVWRREDAIVYRRAPCTAGDTEARFFLQLRKSPDAAGRAGEPTVRYLDFDFAVHGVRQNEKCLALMRLPQEEYSKFQTGQSSGTASWRAAGRLDEERYRAAFRSAASGDWGPPLERAVFDLWLDGREMRYFKEPCTRAEVEPRFFLHLHESADPGGEGGFRRENRDFDFLEYGVVSEGKCLALVPLPDESSFSRIATGQWRPGEPPFWSADLWFPLDRLALDFIVSGAWGPPAARSAFDLYLDEGGLWYYRAPCSAADLEARFFLHLYPLDTADLPTGRGDAGFENRDFAFSEYGAPLDDACLARVPLPEYALARLRTGQFVSGSDPLWAAELTPPSSPPGLLGADWGEPVARSRFDLLLRDSFLAWHRDPCGREDVGDRFFLHLFRHDRVGSGARRLFENRDFDFARHGVFLEGACLAVFRVPDGVASVRTGQRPPGQPGHWSEVVRVDFAPFRAEIEEIVSGRAGPPAARGVFDLYREGRQLRYFRDDCRPEDREVPFFLHLHAADPRALPEHRREHGFEDLDFAFSHHGAVLDGRCLVRVTVPDYEMRRLRTGQGFRDGEPVWEVEIPARN